MKIGELAEAAGVTTKTVRFYESVALLPEPQRTGSGYRSYQQPDVERLRFIKTAQRLGLSLDEIREIITFRDRGERPCAYVADVLDRQVRGLDRRIQEMRALRDELRGLQSNAAGDPPSDGAYCGVIEHTRRMEAGA